MPPSPASGRGHDDRRRAAVSHPTATNKITISPDLLQRAQHVARLPADLSHAQPPHQRNDDHQQNRRLDRVNEAEPRDSTTNPITAAATAPAGAGRPAA